MTCRSAKSEASPPRPGESFFAYVDRRLKEDQERDAPKQEQPE